MKKINKCLPACTLSLSMFLGTTTISWAEPIVPPDFIIEQVTTGLENVQDIYRDPFGRLLVAEQGAVTANSGFDLDGKITEIHPDGTTTVISSGYYNPASVVVNAFGTIYVADTGPEQITGDGDGVVWKENGAGPTVLATGFTTPIDMIFNPANSEHILLSELSGYPPLLSFGDAGIFEVNATNGSTTVYFDDGTGPATSNLTNIIGLTSDSSGDVYASDNGTANIHRITSSSTQAPIISAPNPLITPQRLGFDFSGDLYVTDSSVGTVFKLDMGSDFLAPFVTNVISPVGLLVEENAIYFTEDGTTVWKVSPAVSVDCDVCFEWKNHGEYIRCVAHEVSDLANLGLITEDEGDIIVSSAAQSNVGKKDFVPSECSQ